MSDGNGNGHGGGVLIHIEIDLDINEPPLTGSHDLNRSMVFSPVLNHSCTSRYGDEWLRDAYFNSWPYHPIMGTSGN